MLARVALAEDDFGLPKCHELSRDPRRVEEGLGIESAVLLRFHDEIPEKHLDRRMTTIDSSDGRCTQAATRTPAGSTRDYSKQYCTPVSPLGQALSAWPRCPAISTRRVASSSTNKTANGVSPPSWHRRTRSARPRLLPLTGSETQRLRTGRFVLGESLDCPPAH